MKLRKTALAIAVAGIAAAPMASQADVTLSGILELNVQGSDDDTLANPGDTDGPEVGELKIGAGDVNVNIAAEQELNNGLTGYGNLRFDLDQLSNSKDSNITTGDGAANLAISTDSIFVGVKGDFGDFRLGEVPLAIEYGQKANDIFDIGAEISGGLSYEGNFGPVKVGINHSPPLNQDVSFGVGVEFAAAGFTIGAGVEDRDENQNFAVGAAYGIAGFDLSAHYATLENSVENPANVDVDGKGGDIAIGTPGKDNAVLALQGQYGVGDLSFGLTYTTLAPDTAADTGAQAIRFDVGYDMGGGLNLSSRITQYTFDDAVATGDPDLLQYRIQLAKSF